MATLPGDIVATPSRSVDPDLVDEAVTAARTAARHTGVTVRLLESPAEMTQAAALAAVVWKSQDTSQLDASLLRALAHSGNFVAGAFELAGSEGTASSTAVGGERAAGALVGLSVGFLSAGPAYGLHSHMTCTADGRRDAGLGAALKLHQRAWALAAGLESVTWTFDPLVRRNAYFNLTKLGAHVNAYLPDFYGPMDDGVNVGDESDRLLMNWTLTHNRVVIHRAGGVLEDRLQNAVPLLSVGQDETACRSEDDGDLLACQVPDDIVALRERDQGLGLRWRHALRDALSSSLSRGYRVEGFTRSGFYVLGRDLGSSSSRSWR